MKNVSCIVLNSNTRKITKRKFDGRYESIFDLIGDETGPINWVELVSGDFIYYDMESESKNFISLGDEITFRGNVVIVGQPTEDSDDYDWKCTDTILSISDIEKDVKFRTLPVHEGHIILNNFVFSM